VVAPVNRELLESLVAASSALQHAHKIARDAGREDIAQMLRQAAWKVAAAMTDAVVAPGEELS